MLVSIEGETATAKTTFALTAPLPIVCFSFDIGADYSINGLKFKNYFEGLSITTRKYDRIKSENNGVVPEEHEALWQENDITIYELPQPIQLDDTRVTGYVALWNYFIQLFGLAASSPTVNSLVLDTATIARGVKVNAYIEELNNAKGAGQAPRKQLLQIEYGHPNGAIENIYSTMATIGKTFVATHHMRDQYVPQMVNGSIESVPNGKLELEGWNKTHNFVDIAIETSKVNGEFRAKFIKCRMNPTLEGGWLIGDPNWNNMIDQIAGSLEGRLSFPRR